jgi:hypothetical protein
MTSLSIKQRRMAIVAAVVLITGVTYLSVQFSLMPLLIVGVPGVLAYGLWYVTALQKPLDLAAILPLFLLTVAGFTINSVEEFLGHYGPAVGRLFNFVWTDQAFVVITLTLIGALLMVAIGLWYRIAMAGLVAIIFLTTRLAEVLMFAFPLWPPAIQPYFAGPIAQTVSNTLVGEMPTYYLSAVGRYYFPGMFTVALPIIPAIFALYRIWMDRPSRRDDGPT